MYYLLSVKKCGLACFFSVFNSLDTVALFIKGVFVYSNVIAVLVCYLFLDKTVQAVAGIRRNNAVGISGSRAVAVCVILIQRCLAVVSDNTDDSVQLIIAVACACVQGGNICDIPLM